MSGIYIHIPFCKQACHYCDFHFSTQLDKRDAMVEALCQELIMRKDEGVEPIATIYFGGGTPSLLTTQQIEQLISTVKQYYTVTPDAEITLEANPDDLQEAVLQQLAKSPVNRLSIGVQSFRAHDLKLMNRAHNADEAWQCLVLAKTYFDNISIDLIYGIPGLTDEAWRDNVHKAIQLEIPHISSYALTVEDGTALKHFIDKEVIEAPDDEQAQRQFYMLLEAMQDNGFTHYEFSNFGKQGYFSQNNTAYWTQKAYIGIGPSAHSYNGSDTRSWNINNNPKYLKSISQSILPQEVEKLTTTDQYNEYIMTGLRTIMGVSIDRVAQRFGATYAQYLSDQAQELVMDKFLYQEKDIIRVTHKGKFLSDGIASQLFMLNLKEDND